MSVTTTTTEVEYTGNGVATTFPVPFPFFEEDDLEVTVEGAPVAFTITGNPRTASASVVISPALGGAILIRRAMDFLQPTTFGLQGTFSPKAHEAAFDRVVMQIQDEYTRRVEAVAAEAAARIAAVLSEASARAAADALIVASGAAPANVGIAPVIASGSSALRTVSAHLGDYVNVLNHGALPVQAVPWVWGDVYGPGARVVSGTAPPRLYETVAGGWAGNAAPSGTTTCNDKGTASVPGQDGVDWVYVEDLSDCLAAFNEARAKVATGGKVRLPRGLYYVSATLETDAVKQEFEGDGQENTWIYHPGGGDIALHLKYSQGAAKNLSVFMFTPHASNVGVQTGYDGAEDGYVGNMVIENVGAFASRSFGASLGKGFLLYGLEGRVSSIKSMLWGRALSFEYHATGPLAGPDSAPNAWTVTSPTLRESTLGCHVAGESTFYGGTIEGCTVGMEDDDYSPSWPGNGSTKIRAYGVHMENASSVHLTNSAASHAFFGCGFGDTVAHENMVITGGTHIAVGCEFNQGCTVTGSGKLQRIHDTSNPTADVVTNNGNIQYVDQGGIKPLIIGGKYDNPPGPRLLGSRLVYGGGFGGFTASANTTYQKTEVLGNTGGLPLSADAGTKWVLAAWTLMHGGTGLQYAIPAGIVVSVHQRESDKLEVYITNTTAAPISIDGCSIHALALQVQ